MTISRRGLLLAPFAMAAAKIAPAKAYAKPMVYSKHARNPMGDFRCNYPTFEDCRARFQNNPPWGGPIHLRWNGKAV